MTTLRFVHITDTHISYDPHHSEPGVQQTPLIGVKALVHELKKLPFTPDFVLHTGDVIDDMADESYITAREILGQIPFQTYYIPGNHDSVIGLQKQFLGIENPSETFDYVVDLGAARLICTDSNRPAAEPRGRMSDAQLAWLRAQVTADDPRPILIAVHHNPLKVGIPWWDDYMSMENGEDFHAAILPARDKIAGVFHGHVHQSTDTYRDGILYTSASSSWYQILAFPGQIQTEYDRYGSPGFNIVTVVEGTTFIRRCRYIVDAGTVDV